MGIYQGSKLMSGGGGGPSPYEIAKQNGYTGTEQEFNQLLAALDQNVTEQELNNKADLVNGKVPAEQVDAYTKTEADTLLQNKANTADFQSHTTSKSNPHGVTATQTGAYTKGEIDTLLQNKADKDRVVNPNILDNWYFWNPVDQRQGRVVKPNTTYYSDNTLTTSAGTTSAYVTAYRYATGTASGTSYASFKLEDSDTAPTYYAAPENVVRGYTGDRYTVDRWHSNGWNSQPVIISEDGLVAYPGVGFRQICELESFLIGKTITFSILDTSNHLEVFTFEFQSATAYIDGQVYNIQAGVGMSILFYLKVDQADSRTVKAVKLELGTEQTLAHQDANGNWQLNELPNYADTLARCQRYYVPVGKGNLGMIVAGFHRAAMQVAAFDIPVPVTMRATPIITDVTSYGECLVAGTWYPITNLHVDCAHSGSVRVFWDNTGITTTAPCVTDGAKFAFSAEL